MKILVNKFFIAFCFLSEFFISIQAQVTYDTVTTKIVGPGMTYTRYVTASIPWSIDVFVADIKTQYFALETVKSNDLMAGGKEKTTQMAARRSYNGHWVVGACNGDFFNPDGSVVNIQVASGEVVRSNGTWPTFGYNENKKMSISTPVFSSSVKIKDTLMTVNVLNGSRGTDQLVLFNSYFGSSTNTNDYGTEVRFHPIAGWYANDTLVCVVDTVVINKGNMNLQTGFGVLSAHGIVASYINAKVLKGDTIKIYNRVTNSPSKLREMIGGHPTIIINGATAPMDSADSFVMTRHPRTAVGFNQDTSKIYLVVVDGRQTHSKGMDLFELAVFMKTIGVTQAINLDGGGSSTLVVRDSIKNSPSDGTERLVGNALLIISKSQLGSASIIRIDPRSSRVFIGKTLQFNISVWDQHYNPLPVIPTQVTYSLSNPLLGTINSQGLFTAGMQAANGYVIASYNGIKDSTFITVKSIGYVKITPKKAVTDKMLLITFKASAFDTDSIEYTFPAQSFVWKSLDTTIGKVDLVGQFQGLNPGSTKVVVSLYGKTDTANVSVEIATGVKLVDSVENISDWTLSGLNYDSTETNFLLSNIYKTLGDYSVQLNYKFVYQSGQYNWVYLKPQLPVYGIPDSIFIDVRSDGFAHRVFFDFEDATGNTYRYQCTRLANKPNIFDTLKAPILKSTITFPVTVKSISIVLGSLGVTGQTYNGTIYLDNIRVKYPEPLGIKNIQKIPSGYSLLQNYPNPFNPSTKIQYSLASKENVTLKIFDIIGNEIQKLVDEDQHPGVYEIEFNANKIAVNKELSSGIYFYQLIAGNFLETKKMVFIK